jgi:hypothetical protein
MEGDALAYGVGHDSIVVRSEISSSFFTLAYGPRAKPVGSVPSAQRAGREGAASFWLSSTVSAAARVSTPRAALMSSAPIPCGSPLPLPGCLLVGELILSTSGPSNCICTNRRENLANTLTGDLRRAAGTSDRLLQLLRYAGGNFSRNSGRLSPWIVLLDTDGVGPSGRDRHRVFIGKQQFQIR